MSRDEIKSSGYVVDTFEAALLCFMTTGSYKECTFKAVNLGEDTDTVAAVAGSLAGMLYGVPEDWADCIAKREWIAELCKEYVKSQPNLIRNENYPADCV